ncbi:MAG: quinone-dependent dihydroorotate dehydrogenase [Spirochaetia bacterium]|nr:quinone-dependent dihydroorotate dehydrogenase [Spirochaetia bacterium]
MINFLYKTIRPLIFLLYPETVHELASFWIKVVAKLRRHSFSGKNNLETKLFSHTISVPVGMAAGFDKKGDLVNGLRALDFAVVETGTFTKSYQKGNEKPRVFRIPEQQALFNRMGFNNPGIQKGLQYLEKARHPFAISIGKSRDTPLEDAVDDYTEILEMIENYPNFRLRERIVYIAINVSSPNTPGLRMLQNKKYIASLIARCRRVTKIPLLIKFSPDFTDFREYEDILKSAIKSGVHGVIVTNTTSDENIVTCVPDKIRNRGGGLSGYPLKMKSGEYLKRTLRICKGKIPVISSGGVMEPEDVWKRLEMGASLVQIYTGFIYNGPGFAAQCADYVQKKILEKGFKSFAEYQLSLRGTRNSAKMM